MGRDKNQAWSNFTPVGNHKDSRDRGVCKFCKYVMIWESIHHTSALANQILAYAFLNAVMF